MGKLIDYCTQITDGEHGTVVNDPNGEYFLLSSKNIGLNEIVITNNDRKINKNTFDSLIRKTKLDLGDVVISSVGTLGKTCVIEHKPNYVFQRSVGIIKPNPSLLDSYYLKYQLDLPPFQKRLNFLANGGLQKGLYIGDLEKLIVNCPDIEKQKRIVSILKSIDSKIVLNKKINTELESMAKTLYDYWFLQFEFPNEEGKPYKSSGGKMVYNEELKRKIPEEWKLKHASEIADIKTGKEDANHSSENGQYPFFTCSNDVLKCDDFKFDCEAILIAGNGDFNVKHCNGKFNAYQRTYIISPHDQDNVGLFYLCCKQTIGRFKKGSNGSIVKFITLGDVQNIQMLDCGNKALLSKFNSILEEIEHLKKENQELASMRDFLLPLLMNGQASL